MTASREHDRFTRTEHASILRYDMILKLKTTQSDHGHVNMSHMMHIEREICDQIKILSQMMGHTTVFGLKCR